MSRRFLRPMTPIIGANKRMAQLLDYLAEAPEFPLEARPIADRPGVEPTGRADRWIPCCEIGAVNDDVKCFVGCGFNDLGVSYDCHY